MTTELVPPKKAPSFSLPNESGEKVALKDFKGSQVVLYFYPKDNTPGCTKESCDFRDAHQAIKKAGAVVLGLSLDGQEAHQKFIKKFNFPFSLLSDEEANVSKAYGVYKQKNMYGKKYWGIERSTFVIDEAGRLKAVFRKVKVDGHVKEVLKVLQS